MPLPKMFFLIQNDPRFRSWELETRVLAGGAMLLDGEVTDIRHDDERGPIARVEVMLTNQKGEILAKGPAAELLPGV